MYKFYNNDAKHPHLLSVNCLSRKKRQFFFSEKNNLISIERLSRKKKKTKKKLVSRDKLRHVWSEDDESAEKTNGRERFVEFDREVRRYLFHSYLAEIEWDRS